MTASQCTSNGMTLVAIDIAKDGHDVLIEPPPPARRRRFKMANTVADYQRLADYLGNTAAPALIGSRRRATTIARWRSFLKARVSPYA
jgi:hypothetical protein